MTRSKLELATILAKLRGDDSDPEKLAKEMSLLKLCYEIQKIEEEKELEKPEEPQVARISEKEDPNVQELKAPLEENTKKRNKHILSWLLDSSSDDDA
jgi:hypothetical protein